MTRVPNDRTDTPARQAPPWATDHELGERRQTWTRTAKVPITDGGKPRDFVIRAAVDDVLDVRRGRVVIERDDEPEILVDGTPMSLADARAVAFALLALVEAVAP